MFDSVVMSAFQITFRVKMHANNIFSFFKNHFWHQHIKTIQNVQTILNFSKKQKIQIFWEHRLNSVPKHLVYINVKNNLVVKFTCAAGRLFLFLFYIFIFYLSGWSFFRNLVASVIQSWRVNQNILLQIFWWDTGGGLSSSSSTVGGGNNSHKPWQ